jgi:hypothetical protein
MRKLIAVTGIVAGLLLVIVPRFILPACEYEGFARMHCSDTANAEIVLGAVLAAVGAVAFLMRTPGLLIADAVIACGILGAALYMPNVFGYCASKNMPCHYGMVPGVRFIAVLAMAVLFTGIALMTRDLRKKR